MLRLIDRIVWVFGLCAMIGLIGAYLSSYVNPSFCILPSLFGLAYPYLLVLNLLLLLYWGVRLKRMALMELLVILAGVPSFMTYYGTGEVHDKELAADLSLLSYNVRYFDIYKWSASSDTEKRLYAYLNDYNGDVICLQETMLKYSLEEERKLARHLSSYPYRFVRGDMAIFSRLPIVEKGEIPFPEKDTGAALYCDLTVKGRKVRVYNIHLESYRFGKKDRAFVKDITTGSSSVSFSDGTRSIVARVVAANRDRARQTEIISRHVHAAACPVVVCGDFNDTPLSYTYRKMKSDLKDAFIECGRGLGNTYIGEFPSFRIDYILHSTGLNCLAYRRERVMLSDHYPICARFCIEN